MRTTSSHSSKEWDATGGSALASATSTRAWRSAIYVVSCVHGSAPTHSLQEYMLAVHNLGSRSAVMVHCYVWGALGRSFLRGDKRMVWYTSLLCNAALPTKRCVEAAQYHHC